MLCTRAFADSVYAGERLPREMASLMQRNQLNVMDAKEEIYDEHERKEFILRRIAESGPPGFGLR